MRRIALTATALAAAFAPGAGCQTVGPATLAAAGQAGAEYAYTGGRAVQTLVQPPASVQPAVLSAMDDLRIAGVRQTRDGDAVVLEGTTADNRRATITVRQNGVGTRLTARFGLFGDEPLSRALMDRVGVRLGALPPSAIPVEPPSNPASNPYFSRGAVSDAEMFREQAEAPYRSTAVPANH